MGIQQLSIIKRCNEENVQIMLLNAHFIYPPTKRIVGYIEKSFKLLLTERSKKKRVAGSAVGR